MQSMYNPWSFWGGGLSRGMSKAVYNKVAKKAGNMLVRQAKRGPKATPYKNYLRIKRLQSKPEFKYLDIASSGNVPNTGTFVCLTAITQGDQEQQRDGDQVSVRAVSWKLLLQSNSGYTAEAVTIRVVMFIDTYGRTTPTLNTTAETDLITSGGDAIIQHFKHDNRHRYKVLYDKHFHVGYSTDGDFMAPDKTFEKYYKKFNFKTSYDGTSSTDYAKNQVWLLMYSDKTTDTFPTYKLDTRLHFQE